MESLVQQSVGSSALSEVFGVESTPLPKGPKVVLPVSYPSEQLAKQHGFTVVEDVEPSVFSVKELQFKPLLERGWRHADSREVVLIAEKLKARFGLSDAVGFMEQAFDLPGELRGRYILLTGTKLLDGEGRPTWAYLRWAKSELCLGFSPLSDLWATNGRLPCRV